MEPLELDQIRCQLSASCKPYQKQPGSWMGGRLLWVGCCKGLQAQVLRLTSQRKGSPKSEGRGRVRLSRSSGEVHDSLPFVSTSSLFTWESVTLWITWTGLTPLVSKRAT